VAENTKRFGSTRQPEGQSVCCNLSVKAPNANANPETTRSLPYKPSTRTDDNNVPGGYVNTEKCIGEKMPKNYPDPQNLGSGRLSSHGTLRNSVCDDNVDPAKSFIYDDRPLDELSLAESSKTFGSTPLPIESHLVDDMEPVIVFDRSVSKKYMCSPSKKRTRIDHIQEIIDLS
jgi:hypothetical protein